MFEVLVLVCLASNSNNCFEMEDTRGPYETRQQCIDRSVEMREFINTLPNPVTGPISADIMLLLLLLLFH